MHSRDVHLSVGTGTGTATGQVGVGPCRYAGYRLVCNPTSMTATIAIKNMGVTISGPDSGAANQHDGTVTEANEKIVNGVVEVDVSSASVAGTVDVELFFHRHP